MILTMQADGTLLTTVPERVFQGSNNANTIAVVTDIARTNSLAISFKLPQSGVWTTPVEMTLAENIDEETGFNVWSILLETAMTQEYGNVELQVKSISPTGEVLGSALGSFTVERGVPPTLPATMTTNVYEQILANLSDIKIDLNTISTNIEELEAPLNGYATYSAIGSGFQGFIDFITNIRNRDDVTSFTYVVTNYDWETTTTTITFNKDGSFTTDIATEYGSDDGQLTLIFGGIDKLFSAGGTTVDDFVATVTNTSSFTNSPELVNNNELRVYSSASSKGLSFLNSGDKAYINTTTTEDVTTNDGIRTITIINSKKYSNSKTNVRSDDCFSNYTIVTRKAIS